MCKVHLIGIVYIYLEAQDLYYASIYNALMTTLLKVIVANIIDLVLLTYLHELFKVAVFDESISEVNKN